MNWSCPTFHPPAPLWGYSNPYPERVVALAQSLLENQFVDLHINALHSQPVSQPDLASSRISSVSVSKAVVKPSFTLSPATSPVPLQTTAGTSFLIFNSVDRGSMFHEFRNHIHYSPPRLKPSIPASPTS